jgi:hypothetical protein
MANLLLLLLLFSTAFIAAVLEAGATFKWNSLTG